MNYRKFVKESSAIRYSLNNKNAVCYSRDTDSVYMNGKKLTNNETSIAETSVKDINALYSGDNLVIIEEGDSGTLLEHFLDSLKAVLNEDGDGSSEVLMSHLHILIKRGGFMLKPTHFYHNVSQNTVELAGIEIVNLPGGTIEAYVYSIDLQTGEWQKIVKGLEVVTAP